MSVKVSSWVWHGEECADLAGNELVLMLALADVAGDEGRCRFLDDESDLSYASLAEKVRVDRRTIIRLVAKLRARGLLSQVAGQNGRPNEFTVMVPWARQTGDKLSPVSAGQPVTAVHEPVTTDARTGDTSGVSTSLIRTDVRDVVNAQGFDAFWSIWPRKDSRKTAEAAWSRAVRRTEPGVILAAARAYVDSPHRPEKQFVPYGATWLNGDRWNDPLPEGPGVRCTGPNDRMRAGLDMGARLQAEYDARQNGIPA
ncbi:helix-turn-helix domain-containing protein [Microbacterium sp. NPDC058389]|uniref:helix-turn-helix domain-containing protein n=1 Tax=Microbacterium sp. NPDC058389 TaxID=3346475 RepID=UPI0036607B44